MMRVPCLAFGQGIPFENLGREGLIGSGPPGGR